ncbi:MAG: sulfate permease, partial [Myxococcales bacterium]|nr:sulfate permease [Myxococcales bacterium]
MASSDTAAASGPGRPRAGSPGTSDRAARIRADIIAGTTTAVMLIPQAMAYALLAGLPPIAGLYAALIPPALYAIFGTSRHLAVGPVAMDSLLVAATVGAITVSGPDAYWVIASALAVLVGLVQLALGLSRMGSLVNLISRPVIAGFTSGASILIALSQAGPLLGLKLARNEPVYRKLITIAQRAAEIHGLTLLIGALAIALLVALKRLAPRVPRALVVVTLGALAVWGLGLHARGVAIVGEVPAGLPTPRLPLIDFGLAVELLSAALVIALLSFLEAISSGLATARQDPDRQAASAIDPNRELIALGVANLGTGLLRGYPVAGGLSRTAVNFQAGARTRLSGVITAALVGVTLLALTPAFYYLPKPVLSAIIMVAVFSLLDWRTAVQLARVERRDLAVMLATFLATLVLGVTAGVAFGVALSLAVFVRRASTPHSAVLGRLPGTEVYRNVLRYEEAVELPGVIIMRFDAPLFFAN